MTAIVFVYVSSKGMDTLSGNDSPLETHWELGERGARKLLPTSGGLVPMLGAPLLSAVI